MHKLKSILFLLIVVQLSCNINSNTVFDFKDFPVNFIQLTQINNELVVYNSCDNGNLKLQIINKKDSTALLLYGQQEDAFFYILESTQKRDTVYITTITKDSKQKQLFKFYWLNQNKGLAQWSTIFPNKHAISATFVDQSKQNNFKIVNQPCVECFGDECDEIINPISVIDKISQNYFENEESTDSDENKNEIITSLESISKINNQSEYDILVNCWLYYDPTDFPTRKLIYTVLIKNKSESITAIKERIKHKKEWETNDSAPFSELISLITSLENE